MMNQIYFPPAIHTLYKKNNNFKINKSNQSIYVKTPLMEFMLLEKQRHQRILEQLENVNDAIQQGLFRLQTKQKEMENRILKQAKQTTHILEKAQHLQYGNLQHLKTEIINQLDVQHSLNQKSYDQFTKQFQQLIDSLEKWKEVEKHQANSDLFKLGDRITLKDKNGFTSSGVFVENTENNILWVNDETNRLCISNKKGLTINKE